MSLRSFPLPFSFSHPPVASSRPSPPPFARRPILSFPSSIPIPLKTSSRSPSRAAWRRPVYVYPDPIPEFAKAVICLPHLFTLLCAGFFILKNAWFWEQTLYDWCFSLQETRKFEDDLRRKLLKSKEIFGDDVDTVVELCGEVGDRVLFVFDVVHLVALSLSLSRFDFGITKFGPFKWLVKSTDKIRGLETKVMSVVAI